MNAPSNSPEEELMATGERRDSWQTATRSQTDIFVREKIRLERGTSGGHSEFSWRFSLHNEQDRAEDARDRTGTKLKWNKAALWL